MSYKKKLSETFTYETILNIKKENDKQINFVYEILNKINESYNVLLNDIVFLEKSLMNMKIEIARENGLSEPHKQLFDGYLNIFYNKIISSAGIIISNEIGESTSAIKQINFNLPIPNYKQTIKVSYKIEEQQWMFNKPLCELDNVLFINEKDKLVLYIGEIKIEINKITKIQKMNEIIFDNILEKTLNNLSTFTLTINSNILIIQSARNFLKNIASKINISNDIFAKINEVNKNSEKEFMALTEQNDTNIKKIDYNSSIFTKLTSTNNDITETLLSENREFKKTRIKNKDINICIDELLE